VGYFKRKLDRSRSRRLVRALNDAAVDGKAWQAIPGRPPRAGGFVRFSARDLHEESGRRRGIFSAAYRVLRSHEVDPHVAHELRNELAWFGENLFSPDLDHVHAVFLFKSDARECMKHIWALLHHLREAGVWVEMQTFQRPGRAVYQDDQQVAVIPWADASEI
jgi:hypothetical protein